MTVNLTQTGEISEHLNNLDGSGDFCQYSTYSFKIIESLDLYFIANHLNCICCQYIPVSSVYYNMLAGIHLNILLALRLLITT